MVRNFNMTEKVQCQKIDKYYFRNSKGRIFKYSQFCRRKNCKTESSYYYENLNPSIVLNIKKKIWLILKEGINCVKSVNHLIKQNVLPQNVNIQFKNIKQLQNT